MRTLFIFGLAFLLVGCSTSMQQSVLLTAEKAQQIAVQVANEKATALYHCQPFGSRQAAHFAEGRWVWVDRQGYGHGDIEASVELAANGSTNSVDIKILDSKQMPLPMGF